MRPLWRRFVSQLTELPTLILMAGAGMSALAGRTAELLAAGAATALTALVGAWREGQESNTQSALRALTPRRATALRGGKQQEVDATTLVPGDQVILNPGDLVPADVKVVQSADLLVDERHLLGAHAAGPRPVPAGRLVHAGCEVVRGRAQAQVAAIDGQTLLGKVARSLQTTERPPSLVESRMGKLTRQLLKVAAGALGVVFVAGILRGLAPLEVLQSGFGLAAAVVPEGLPIYLTLALAAGARRMARRSAYVRDLALAETAGAVDVICTDIAGTLTRGLAREAGAPDPVRHELRPVLQQLARDHIRTVIITGDHPETAAFVAQELGLESTTATGADIARLDDEQLARLATHTAIFARVNPEQKARIIRALQWRGQKVAYVGDGIDDAPAIQAADVGAVPQHRAAGLAQEAAGIILADDRFETLVEAIRQGRATAANTGEITRFLLAGHTAEILVLVASAVAGLPMALLPLQLLWLNLIAGGPVALGIGERKVHPGVTLPRQPKAAIKAHGLEMGAAAFGLYITAVLGGAPVAAARTMVLGALAAGQILYLMRCQTTLGTPCGLKFPSEPTVAVATGLSGLLVLATLYFPPLATALGTVPLDLGQWLAVMAAALAGNLSAVADFKLRPQAATA